jgi:hypothetical protein
MLLGIASQSPQVTSGLAVNLAAQATYFLPCPWCNQPEHARGWGNMPAHLRAGEWAAEAYPPPWTIDAIPNAPLITCERCEYPTLRVLVVLGAVWPRRWGALPKPGGMRQNYDWDPVPL